MLPFSDALHETVEAIYWKSYSSVLRKFVINVCHFVLGVYPKDVLTAY